MFGKVVAATVLAAGALVATASAASAAPASAKGFSECMDYAVVVHDIDPWLAHSACDASMFDECYWVLRSHYVPAVVAGTACRMADN